MQTKEEETDGDKLGRKYIRAYGVDVETFKDGEGT